MKTVLIVTAIFFILWGLDEVRKKAIVKKRVNGAPDAELPKEEERALWHLTQKVAKKAIKSGVSIPRNNFICRLNDDDPYTWIILKLGFKSEKEIYRCRVTIEDIAECHVIARKELEEEKKEEA